MGGSEKELKQEQTVKPRNWSHERVEQDRQHVTNQKQQGCTTAQGKEIAARNCCSDKGNRQQGMKHQRGNPQGAQAEEPEWPVINFEKHDLACAPVDSAAGGLNKVIRAGNAGGNQY